MKTLKQRETGDVELGKRLRSLRLERGLTQAELAQPSYTHAYVSTIEAGRRTPSEEALEFFAEKLSVEVDELVTGRPPGLAADLRRRLEEARLEISKGNLVGARDIAKQVSRQAREFELPRVQARAYEIDALAMEQEGNAERALHLYEKAVDVLRHDAPTARAYAIAGQIRCLKALNEPHHAIFIGENYLERLKREHMAAPAAVLKVKSALVLAYFVAGSPIKAKEVSDECQRLIPKVNDPANLAAAYVNIGGVQLEQGHHVDANISFAKAEELFETIHLSNEAAMALLARGYNYARNGEPAKARKALEKASTTLELTGNVPEHANAEMELARLDRMDGKSRAAVERLKKSLNLIKGRDQLRLEAWAHRELGLAQARLDKAQSEKHFMQAIELYERQNIQQEVARTHVILAELKPARDAKGRLEDYRRAAAAIKKLPEV